MRRVEERYQSGLVEVRWIGECAVCSAHARVANEALARKWETAHAHHGCGHRLVRDETGRGWVPDQFATPSGCVADPPRSISAPAAARAPAANRREGIWVDTTRTLKLAVEPAAAGMVGIRVAGELTTKAGLGLLRLLEDVLRRGAASGRVQRLVVDLAGVRHFEVDGLAVLRHARHSALRHGIDLIVAGLDDHRAALPRQIEAVLTEFATIDSLDTALAETHPAP